MDYKQKYNEALERAKAWIENRCMPSDTNRQGILEDIFHELKESEDERIRKSLISYLHGLGEFDYPDKETYNNWLAWLEKQGECHISHNDEIMIKQLTEYFTTGHGLQNTNETVVEWLNDVKEKLEKQDEVVSDKDDIEAEEKGIRKAFNKIENEKQCKQKSQRMISAEAKEAMYDKPSDKVEPKFKVGDWVVYYRNDSSREVLQVYDIRDGRYYFTDNVHFSWSVKECDEKSHLWTIQDAKDGDVLVFKNNIGGIIICKSPTYYNTRSYCRLVSDNLINKEESGWDSTLLVPATKEQHDLLFQKMKEAGYEWDAEKKELKKIEKKSTWNEDDERIYQSIIDDTVQENQLNCEQTNWLRDIKYRYFQQPKQEWSEEDEEIMSGLLSFLLINTSDQWAKYGKWILSLKERMRK